MAKNYYLTFTLNNLCYGIDTMAVQEIFYLPEITPIPESPPDIVGIVNLRGNLIPIMDLNLRFGYPSPDYTLTDSIIIVNWQELRLGIIANHVHEVKQILPSEITTELSYDQKVIPIEQEKFIEGIARSGKDLSIILDLERLLRYIRSQDIPTEEIAEEETPQDVKKTSIFYPHATPKEREILQKRATDLRQIMTKEDVTGLKPLAVVLLGEEFFGVELQLVREFTKVTKVTPIPCTPPHIVGNMNLRGEVLTLVDLRGLLNLHQSGIVTGSKAMIADVEGVVTAIVVSGVRDVVLLNPKEVIEVPTVTHSVNEEYLQGITPYGDVMMSILDLPKALLHGGLIIDEAV